MGASWNVRLLPPPAGAGRRSGERGGRPSPTAVQAACAAPTWPGRTRRQHDEGVLACQRGGHGLSLQRPEVKGRAPVQPGGAAERGEQQRVDSRLRRRRRRLRDGRKQRLPPGLLRRHGGCTWQSAAARRRWPVGKGLDGLSSGALCSGVFVAAGLLRQASWSRGANGGTWAMERSSHWGSRRSRPAARPAAAWSMHALRSGAAFNARPCWCPDATPADAQTGLHTLQSRPAHAATGPPLRPPAACRRVPAPPWRRRPRIPGLLRRAHSAS